MHHKQVHMVKNRLLNIELFHICSWHQRYFYPQLHHNKRKGVRVEYTPEDIQWIHRDHRLPISNKKYVTNTQQSQPFLSSQFNEIFVLDVLRKGGTPINTMKQSRNVRQIFLAEITTILARSLVEVSLIENCSRV